MKRVKTFATLVTVFGLIWGARTFMLHLADRSSPASITPVTVPDGADPVLSSLLSGTLEDASGTPQNLQQWRNKPLLVNFWASWCAPCLEEMPRLDSLARHTNSKNLQILGIALDRKENVAEYARVHRPVYPLLLADDKVRALLPALGNPAQGIPFSLLADAQGHILHLRLGVLEAAELEDWLRTLKTPTTSIVRQKL